MKRQKVRVITVGKHSLCNRCGLSKECRDVFDDRKPICFECTKPAELAAYGKRLFSVSSS